MIRFPIPKGEELLFHSPDNFLNTCLLTGGIEGVVYYLIIEFEGSEQLHYNLKNEFKKMQKILNIVEDETGGKCCKSFQYCFDTADIRPTYDEEILNFNYDLKNQGETEVLSEYKNLENHANYLKNNKIPPLFKYFLDGSRRTYKVDDIVFNDNGLYPIMAGQIGVGCCERNLTEAKFFKPTYLKKLLVLSFPECASKDGNKHFFNNLLNLTNKADIIQKRKISFDKILTYSNKKLNDGELYENRGIITIQNEMLKLEKILVDKLVRKNLLNQDAYLMKDGSLEYSEKGADKGHSLSILKNNYNRVVGVSKSFNPYLLKDKRNKNIANSIVKLPAFCRTPAYKYKPNTTKDTYFSVWYVRLNRKENMFNPLDGVLKVEKILTKDSEIENGLNSEEIDNISANLINERSPTCYGIDKRWANHLYPIYLTERYIKSQYLSNTYFLNLF